jgi:hypothetical protein
MLSKSLYQTLRGGETRLLTIRSQSNFTLENAYLRDNPYYVAISYCWGDVKDLCNVRVNDYEVPLRGHVYAMLSNLYHKYQVTRLWLDMVCMYSYQTATKCCRFRPQFCEGVVLPRSGKTYAPCFQEKIMYLLH